MEKLLNTCESIRKDLETLYNLTDEERKEREERGEETDIWEWLDGALNIEYTISGCGDYLSARVWVRLGGPNVWIDTRNYEIRGAWGSKRAETWLPSEICNEIDSCMEEKYLSLK